MIFAGTEGKEMILSFSKGDVILKEGQHYSMIFQILSGSCRIEKTVKENNEYKNVILGKMMAGEMFGEVNFLTEAGATATVVADSNVVMYFIDGEFIKKNLIEADPHLVVRFYHYICTVLAKRILTREQEGLALKSQK